MSWATYTILLLSLLTFILSVISFLTLRAKLLPIYSALIAPAKVDSATTKTAVGTRGEADKKKEGDKSVILLTPEHDAKALGEESDY